MFQLHRYTEQWNNFRDDTRNTDILRYDGFFLNLRCFLPQPIHFYFLLVFMGPDPQLLITLVEMQMPFGKYKGTLLCNLPVSYLEWFQRKGFPEGKLGMLLQTIYEIKLNGLEYLLVPLRKRTT